MKRALLTLPLMVVAVWLVVANRRPAQVTVLTGSTMGTTYNVRIADALSPDEQTRWQWQVQQCLDGINARMSTYQADSEISCFNRSASTDWYPVSKDTATVVEAAQQVASRTGGAFDVTIGPLVNLWNFGPDRRPLGVPSDEEIEAAQANVGYARLEVRLDPPALRKEIPQLYVDLSGIAKGYAVDRVGELLERGGIEAYMAEVGGEVRTRGTKSDGIPWRIGLERPVVGERIIESILELEDDCLASSGDYRNVFECDGVYYSHEIDPVTGRPVQHGVAAVSVLSKSAMQADAYATAFMILTPDKAWRLAKELQLEIMLVTRERQGFERRVTKGFQAAVVDEEKSD